jgi:hypothetical protein
MSSMIFLNVAWMERYEGLIGNDSEIRGGGSYVEEYGYGHEIFNFKEIDGKVYGYVQPGGFNNLLRLGASKDDEYIEDVLVIFTATHRDGGTYIVGWYKNAIFFKDHQNIRLKERKFRDEYIGYYAVADAQNATLLGIDERFAFPTIPRRVKGGMGQSNVWYADSPEMVEFKKGVLRHIDRYEKKKSIRHRLTVSRQTDVEAKKKIESIAIGEVSKEYTDRGFFVSSVETENVGWDLEAVYKKTILRIEVKGLSGSKVSVEITPNEFKNMNAFKDTYRLCVVTDCLDNPIIHVFSYSTERDEWLNEEGELLIIDQIISARCYL